VKGPAACALWWTIQKILQPQIIIAAQRNNELGGVLAGLKFFDFQLELVNVPQELPLKSMQQRQNHRQEKFREYFRSAGLFNIDLEKTAIQMSGYGTGIIAGKLIGLRDSSGNDLAVGIVSEQKENTVAIKAPPINIEQAGCIVIGDVTIGIDI
jgi:polynucleotide 5'-kinase involved in rRNA processing